MYVMYVQYIRYMRTYCTYVSNAYMYVHILQYVSVCAYVVYMLVVHARVLLCIAPTVESV